MPLTSHCQCPCTWPQALLPLQVKLPSSNIESYTKEAPTSLSGTTLTYGPYSDVAPFSFPSRMRLHYENNSPFLEALSLARDVEVSHWGNVYVEERYVLQHTGARHKVRVPVRVPFLAV